MVDGIFVQKSTLAASFAAAASKSPSSSDVFIGRSKDGRSISTTDRPQDQTSDRSQDRVSGEAGVVTPSHASRQGGDEVVPSGRGFSRGGAGVVMPGSHACRDGSRVRNAGPPAASSSALTHRSPPAKGSVRRGEERGRLEHTPLGNMSFASARGGIGKTPPSGDQLMPPSDEHAKPPSGDHAVPRSGNHALGEQTPSLRAASPARRPATDIAPGPSSPRPSSQTTASGEGTRNDRLLANSETHTMVEVGNGGRGTPSDGVLEGSESPAVDEGTEGGGGGGRAVREPGGAPGVSPFELPDMGAAGESGRSTKDDPAFMKTFFQNSRLHFIGVG